jgi:hypothetical protein
VFTVPLARLDALSAVRAVPTPLKLVAASVPPTVTAVPLWVIAESPILKPSGVNSEIVLVVPEPPIAPEPPEPAQAVQVGEPAPPDMRH